MTITHLGELVLSSLRGSPRVLSISEMFPGLKKNLVSVAILEDKGYDVKGKAYLKHVASRAVKPIGVRVKNLYRLQVETCATLSNKAGGELNFSTGAWDTCIMGC